MLPGAEILWVRQRSQIARIRPNFDRFSAISETLETEMGSSYCTTRRLFLFRHARFADADVIEATDPTRCWLHRTGLPLSSRNRFLVVAGAGTRGMLTRVATGRAVARRR